MARMSVGQARLGVLLCALIGVAWPSTPGTPGIPVRSLVRITGVVYDSLAEGPLAGADVQILPASGQGKPHDVVTDAAGHFVVTDIDSGSYVVGTFHPKLDSLGLELPPVALEVVGSEPVELQLAVPSRRSIVARFCPDSVRHDATTVLTGSVRDAATGSARSNAALLVSWGEVALDERGLNKVQRGGRVQVGPTGRFVVCNIPVDAELTARAAAGPDTSGAIDFKLPAIGILARDLFVPSSATPAPAGVDPVAFRESTLRGRVVKEDGTALPEASVTVWGQPGEVRTNARGEFAIGELPGGTTTVLVKAIGYDAVRTAIDLRTGTAPNTMRVVLMRNIPLLAKVDILESADAVLSRVGFMDRNRAGMGRYLDSNDIARSGATTTTSLVGRFAGTVLRSSGRGTRLFMYNSYGGPCAPTVWVDGQRLDPQSENEQDAVIDIDLWADPTRLAGIEIYTRANEAPLQFAGTTKFGCGIVVLWHRSRPAPAQPQ